MVSKRNLPTILKSQADFKNIYISGKRVFPNSWLILNYKKNQLGSLRFGWTIPRSVGSAVTRNKLKRWCREIIRNELNDNAEAFDINIVFRKKDKEFYKNLTYEQFKTKLLAATNKIIKAKSN